MKRSLPFVIIAAVACASLGAGTMLFRAKRETALAISPPETTNAKAGAQAVHVRGDAKAQLTIEEFADFQCPPCAALSGIMHKLEEDYRGRVRIVFRHFPLKNHQHARPAALAAEAAALQGNFGRCTIQCQSARQAAEIRMRETC